MLLSVENITKSYGDHTVLHDVTLTLDAGRKVGLVGANGAGKSTLLNIIAGVLEPDGGRVELAPGTEIGYLPQTLATAAGQSIDAMLDAALGEVAALEAQMRRVEAQMSTQPDDLDALLAEYARLTDAFERRGGYDLPHRLDAVLAGLGLAHVDRTRPVETLSGGEKSRAGLAALLLSEPDLLLLDEPTNHLDFAALAWLEEYLAAIRSGVLVVSHDRQFLNATVQAIVEIDEHTGQATWYTGNYDAYAETKAREKEKWVEEYWAQQEEIWELRRIIKGKARQVAHNRPARDNDKFIVNFKGERVATAIARNVHAAEEKLRRLEENPIPKPPAPLSLNPDFRPQDLVNRSPLIATNIHKRYGERIILDGIDLSLSTGTRAVLVGPNGAGKTTLLRILAGIEPPDTGEVSRAASAVVGYLDQEQETLPESGTLFEVYRNGRTGDYEEIKAELLKYGLFTYPDLIKPVAALSVGQKRKLQIARLIAQKANLLLLDEPTNHISFDVLEEVEAALLDFPGPILAASHDRRFIRRFATEIWHLAEGKLRRYLGGWEEFERVMSTL